MTSYSIKSAKIVKIQMKHKILYFIGDASFLSQGYSHVHRSFWCWNWFKNVDRVLHNFYNINMSEQKIYIIRTIWNSSIVFIHHLCSSLSYDMILKCIDHHQVLQEILVIQICLCNSVIQSLRIFPKFNYQKSFKCIHGGEK